MNFFLVVVNNYELYNFDVNLVCVELLFFLFNGLGLFLEMDFGLLLVMGGYG